MKTISLHSLLAIAYKAIYKGVLDMFNDIPSKCKRKKFTPVSNPIKK
jgi:hypothetical protein